MVHIYHGDGKGKTTAAMGLALRMLGTGKRVFVVQFLKGRPTGEVIALLKVDGVTVLRGKPDTKFVFEMTGEERDEVTALHMRQLELAFASAREGRCDLLLLDEALDAIGTGTLDEKTLLTWIEEVGNEVEIILTGRNPSDQLIAAADYVTFMQKAKHPFDRGVSARKGIEY